MRGFGFGAAAQAKEGVAAVAGGGFVALGFGFFECLDGFFDQRRIGCGIDLSSVLGEQEDAAGVGDLGVLAAWVCGFCGTDGLPGPGELMLLDRKSTRLNSSHVSQSRMPSSA